MRHQPLSIGGIAREPAADMVVYAAAQHVLETSSNGIAILGCAVLQPAQPQRLHKWRVGEFRCAAQSAGLAVDHPVDAVCKRGKLGIGELRRRMAGCQTPGDVRFQLLAARGQAFLLLLPRLVHCLEHLNETRAAVARLFRKIGAAPERLGIGGQEHGQWPAALLTHRGQGGHVDLVDVGPFLAIDLDIDEQTVHDGGDIFALEALMRHDMAPVAGCIADRQQDRLLGLNGLSQRLWRPGSPVHGIVAVLAQIGAGFFGQKIFGRQRQDVHLTQTVAIGRLGRKGNASK